MSLAPSGQPDRLRLFPFILIDCCSPSSEMSTRFDESPKKIGCLRAVSSNGAIWGSFFASRI